MAPRWWNSDPTGSSPSVPAPLRGWGTPRFPIPTDPDPGGGDGDGGGEGGGDGGHTGDDGGSEQPEDQDEGDSGGGTTTDGGGYGWVPVDDGQVPGLFGAPPEPPDVPEGIPPLDGDDLAPPQLPPPTPELENVVRNPITLGDVSWCTGFFHAGRDLPKCLAGCRARSDGLVNCVWKEVEPGTRRCQLYFECTECGSEYDLDEFATPPVIVR